MENIIEINPIPSETIINKKRGRPLKNIPDGTNKKNVDWNAEWRKGRGGIVLKINYYRKEYNIPQEIIDLKGETEQDLLFKLEKVLDYVAIKKIERITEKRQPKSETLNNGLIYILKDKNGFFYVGQSVNIKKRLTQHKATIKRGSGSCGSYLLDIDFTHEILEEKINKNILTLREQYWFDYYKAEYGDKLINKIRPVVEVKWSKINTENTTEPFVAVSLDKKHKKHTSTPPLIN